MIQEEKDLLLKDLCARLPYGVKVQIISRHPVVLGDGNEIDELDEPYNISLTIDDHDSLVDFFDEDWVIDIKPYLRPMSSMTKDEAIRFQGFKIRAVNSINIQNSIKMIDWLLEHHFDYHGLIEKGLALPAPEDMYKEE